MAYTIIRDGELVEITDAEYQVQFPQTPEAPEPMEPVISDRQFFQALASSPYAIITTQEALDAVKTGEIPAVMQAVIDEMPPEQQFAATMVLAGGTEFVRDNPLVNIFGQSQGMDADAIDDFWRFAAGL